MTVVDVRVVSDVVWERLDAITGVNAFDGEFVDDDGKKVNPPVDEDKRVHAYAVFYPSPGIPAGARLGGRARNLAWSFQITCAGGDRTRALWCVSRVRAALTGIRIELATGKPGLIREIGDPGPLRRDDDVSPVRFWLPLDFALHITAGN